MRRRLGPLLVSFVALAPLVSAGPAAAAPTSRVERSDRSAVVVHLGFDRPTTELVAIEGEEWQLVAIEGLGETGVPGWPALPAYTALIGVPDDVVVRDVRAVPGKTERVDGPPVAPTPEPVRDPAGGARTSGSRVVPAWSRTDAAYPAAWAELEEVSWWRNRRVAVVTLHPVRTRPGRSGFEAATELTLTLSFAEGRVPDRKPLAARFGDDAMDHTVDRLLLNGPESREWLRSEAPRAYGRAGRRRGATDYFSSAPTWVKIKSRGEGILHVTGSALQAAGVTMPIDATSLRVFSGPALELGFDMPPSFDEWLEELAVRVEDGGDGMLDASAGDRVEIFAQPVDGFADELDASSTDSTYTMHQYTSDRVYWLAWGNGFTSGPPRRMSVEAVVPEATTFTPVDQVTEHVHVEQNTFYEPTFKALPDSQVGVDRWRKDLWEKWWWNQGYSIADNSTRIVTFPLSPHVEGTAGQVLVRLFGATATAHYVTLTLNNQAIPLQSWPGRDVNDVILDAGALPGYIVSGQNRLTLRVEPSPPRSEDKVMLGFIEVWHERPLAWVGDPFAFRSHAADGVARYTLTGLPSTSVAVYDVTDPRSPLLLTGGETSGAAGAVSLVFDRMESAGVARRYFVSATGEQLSPRSVEIDAPPGGTGYLKERSGPVDYLVIYADPFSSAADALADFRNGFVPGVTAPSAEAVRLSDVYDEFSGGLADPSAVRRFIRFAYDTYRDPGAPTTPRLRYVTLLGDADYDRRDFASTSGIDYFPAWTERYDPGLLNEDWEPSWPSDDYFGLLDDPQGRLMWVAVGRLPAASVGEANGMVAKTIAHATASDRSPWFQRALFSADDLCQGLEWDAVFYTNWSHTRQCEEDLIPELPEAIEKVKVYLVDYPDPVNGLICTGVTKPSARDAFIDAVNRGVFMLDYVGHGGETVMADERVLESADVAAMRNAGRYHYFITASCTVGKFDDVGEGLGETVLKRTGAGAVNSLSAAAVAFSGANVLFNAGLLGAMFRGGVAHPDSVVPFGDAFVLAKAGVTGSLSTRNTRKYNVMGDPANVIPWAEHTIDLELSTAAPRVEPATETKVISRRARESVGSVRKASLAGLSVAEPAGVPAPGDTLWRGELATLSAQVLDHTGQPVPGYTGIARVEVYDSEELRARENYMVTGNSGGEVLVRPVDYLLPGAPIYRAEVPVVNGSFASTFFVPTGLRRGERGDARVLCHVVGDDGHDALSTLTSIYVPPDPRVAPSDDADAPVIEIELGGPDQAIPVSSSIRLRLTDESGIYITQLLDSRSAVLSFEDAGGFVVSLIDLSSQIVFGEDFTEAELEVPIPTSLEVGRPYILKVRASDNVGNRASVERQVYFVVSDSPEVQRVFAYPNPASSRTAFFVDVNVAVDVKMDVYTVTGRRIRTLETRFGPGEGRTRPLSWNLRDEDGDAVANGSYLYVMKIEPSDGGATEERQGWIAVLR